MLTDVRPVFAVQIAQSSSGSDWVSFVRLHNNNPVPFRMGDEERGLSAAYRISAL